MEWKKWVDRLTPFYEFNWKKLWIYQLIQMSKETITFQTNMIQGTLRFWSPDYNSFIFPKGPMSVTLRDVYYMTWFAYFRF